MLQVSDALKRFGEELPFEATVKAEDQEYGGRPLLFEKPLHVEGTYCFDGKAICIKAKVDTVLHSTCARCAEEFSEPLTFDIEERFFHSADLEPEQDDYSYEGESLDLDAAVMDDLYLNLPIISYCKPDCKGLCPVCGANRNYTTCSCDVPGPLNAFSALRDEF